MIVNLGRKKGKNSNQSSPQLTRLKHSSLMSIIKTPEKYLSNVECKSDRWKARTSSVNLSSTLFSFSIRAMYNRLNHEENVSL